jgi:hypothetical protein
MKKSWTIRVEDARIQSPTFAIQSKDDCYVSANTKLVAIDKAVSLSSEQLAERFRDAILDVMRKRHGDVVTLHIQWCSSSGDKRGFDDALVLARIQQNMFAPNKRPIMRDEKAAFSDKERELLDLFNSCDDRGRELVLISARVAATTTTERTVSPICEVISLFNAAQPPETD